MYFLPIKKLTAPYCRPFMLILLSMCGTIACGIDDLTAQSVGDELHFPYQAIVMANDAAVRSGPGAVHYPTHKMKQGTTVEVYRHDPGNWCAIRPPQSSFSLIPAAAVQVIEDGVGEIIEDGTQAWIGTQLGPVEQPLWQIKLKAGETVELLGEANWPDPSGNSTTWYQIAPPAGEFRWIQMADLQLPPAMAATHPSAARFATTDDSNHAARIESWGSDSNSVQPASYQSPEREQKTARLNGFDSIHNVESINQGWRQASRSGDDRPTNGHPDNTQSGKFSSDSRMNFEPSSTSRMPQHDQWSNERLASTQIDPRFDFEQLAPLPNRNPAIAISDSNRGSFQTYNSNNGLDSILPLGNYYGSQPLTPRLTELELKLNREMIKEPNQWRLIDLQTASQTISGSTTDSVEQLQAQRLLVKLENCRQIRSDYLEAFHINGNRDNDSSINGSSNEEFSLDTIYDAHGWLNELVRDGGTKRSTYVLQDDNGKITHHISPKTGMNLSSYLKTKVGIIGQRGYHTELKLAHVTAERVIELKAR